ncbi:CvpA family protein [Tissierella creatinophila]|uniref:Colicin V production protein n=1 Tax=Tissierella creatinophila DSM 6911 TaxID=1123403 RepID=A0A1U7M2X0_TISCR|nr:CvpA family protein [Tissierella creatinophila]OLS01626.1 colicin V production protein [Tissierella creatinophila DSM 6911]
MNIIDLIILAIIGLTALSGYRRGFILSFFSLIRLFFAIIISKALYPYIINFMTQNTSIYNGLNNFLYPKIQALLNGPSLLIADKITYLIIKLFIIIIIYFIVNSILILIIRQIDSFFKLPILNTLNKFSGLIFGFAKGVLLIYIIYALLTPVIMLKPESFISVSTTNSALARYFYKPDFILNYLKDNYLNLINSI